MKYIFFDLDCTLYYLDEENFLPAYFDAIGKWAVKIGFDYKTALKAMYEGSINMSNSDGIRTNDQFFWEAFTRVLGPLTKEKRAEFDAYYDQEFAKLEYLSKPVEGVNEIVKTLKDKGYTLIVNTNPILPIEAQLVRMKWGKLNPDDYAFITAYDKLHYSKPDPRLYKELADMFNADPNDCLMVGNDVKGDILAAKKAGFNVFLITNYIFNRDNDDISNIPQGSFNDLLKYIDSLK